MGVFDVGFVAVIGAFAYAFYENRNKTKIKLAQSQGAGSSDEVKAELEKLKQRVATLETIVTDKSYQLKDQISKL
ncbi:hypothetical protein [Rheinheimera sp.]|uniref:hypothetical protein n=1 Tax=Rheinheimera sp. TaxID=1869214 RepID=UPI00307EB320